MNTRLLGWLCIIGSLIAIADGLRLVISGHQDIAGVRELDTLQYITQIVWALGTLCGLIALIRLKLVGTNPIFNILSYVPTVGYIALVIGLFLGMFGLPTENNPVGIIGQLLSMAGMVVLAILVLAAKTWKGWGKFTPLLIILAIPAGAMLVEITGLDGWFIIVNAAATALFGYAILNSELVAHWTRAIA